MNDLKIGPCAVIYQDEFLGVCDDGLQFRGESVSQAATSQQSYAQAVDRTLTALNLTVTVDVARPARAMALLFGENGALGLSALGRHFRGRSGELRLIPLNPLDSAGYRMRCAVPNLNFQYQFKSASPHMARITFDILPDADGLLVQCIEAGAADRALIPPNAAIDVIALEQALTACLAALLGLTENEEIYCGEIPELKYGCIVAVEGQVVGKAVETSTFQAAVTFYHPERAGVMAFMNTLTQKLPVYGISFARMIRYDGQVFPAPVEHGTISYFNGKVNLSIIV